MANTYFKESKKEDYRQLRKRMKAARTRYASKPINTSFNLELYMHDKHKQESFP